MKSEFLFTSESVSEGHPDKVADQISDSVLDAILAQDPKSRVAAETLCNTGLVVLAGEITTHAIVDYIQVARETIKRIGYDNTEYGIDYRGCAVLVAYDKQSADIAQGVDKAQDDNLDQGAGDQGLMFGYACDETPVLMPAPIYYAHRLVERQAMLRKDGRLPWLRPDAKSQVTLRYVDGKPAEIDTVGLSTQHAPEVSNDTIRVAKPLNVTVYTEGTGVIPDDKLAQLVQQHFDLRPRGIVKMLDLLRPLYAKTAAYGHFGRDEPEFSWEQLDKVALLRDAAGLKGEGRARAVAAAG